MIHKVPIMKSVSVPLRVPIKVPLKVNVHIKTTAGKKKVYAKQFQQFQMFGEPDEDFRMDMEQQGDENDGVRTAAGHSEKEHEANQEVDVQTENENSGDTESSSANDDASQDEINYSSPQIDYEDGPSNTQPQNPPFTIGQFYEQLAQMKHHPAPSEHAEEEDPGAWNPLRTGGGGSEDEESDSFQKDIDLSEQDRDQPGSDSAKESSEFARPVFVQPVMAP